MPKDKDKPDEYPKLSENDKMWKNQDEFDSSGPQRQLEDDDKNASIAKTAVISSDDEKEKNKNA